MEESIVDFDKLFEHKGGFAMAVAKLRAYAIVVIHKRSGPKKNGRAVAKLDAQQLVLNALSRLTEMPSLENGEEVYFQLRRHIDNEVRTLQKKKPEPALVSIALGTPTENSPEVAEPEDCNATSPAEDAERSVEDEFYRTLFQELYTQYKKDSPEHRLIGHILDGWTERAEIAELMGINPDKYDPIFKRVCRAALALKNEHLKKKAV